MNPSCDFFLFTQTLKHFFLVPGSSSLFFTPVTSHCLQDHRSRSELVTTDTELSAMAMAA